MSSTLKKILISILIILGIYAFFVFDIPYGTKDAILSTGTVADFISNPQ